MEIDAWNAKPLLIAHQKMQPTFVPSVLGRLPLNDPFISRMIKEDFPTDASPANTTRKVLSGGPVGSVESYWAISKGTVSGAILE